jgi:phosphate uptake regulator
MVRDLGYRRVQFAGRGAYIISLPKEWVNEVSIEKGSEIDFIVNDDLSLLLVPRKIVEKKSEERLKLNEYWISVSSKDDVEALCRKITALYVVGASLIHVRFSSDLENSAQFRLAIRSLVRNTLLGSEIIDEDQQELIIQILINHFEFPVEKAIRRMFALALLADKSSILAIKDFNRNLVEEAASIFSDVNRLNLYVVRQLKFGLEHSIYKDLGFKSPKEFLGYRIVVNILKNIAENALNLINSIAALKRMIDEQILFVNEPLDEENYSQILQLNSSAHRLLEDSMKAMLKRDYALADKVIAKSKDAAAFESDLVTLLSTKKIDPNIAAILRLAVDNINRMIKYGRDMAEVALNRTVEEVALRD